MAAGEASPDEAKAMAVRAAEYLKANGPDKAFPAFNAKDGPWHDRDLYVIVQNDKGIMLMHGNNPGLAGKSVAALRDPGGRSISDEVIAIEDAGWVNFKWQNPLTSKIEQKTEYIVRVGEYRVGVGAYVQ
jgi:signal transduction histidine kinase